MNAIIIAGIFTVIGAALGFLGTLIQSKISAKNNIETVKAQSKKEIERHKYFEKEKLYSDIITFLPQLIYSINTKTEKINLDRNSAIMLNSFKARLSIFSTETIYKEFYKLADLLCSEENEEKRINNLNAFTTVLIEDLKKV
jgi:hypothetical protein